VQTKSTVTKLMLRAATDYTDRIIAHNNDLKIDKAELKSQLDKAELKFQLDVAQARLQQHRQTQSSPDVAAELMKIKGLLGVLVVKPSSSLSPVTHVFDVELVQPKAEERSVAAPLSYSPIKALETAPVSPPTPQLALSSVGVVHSTVPQAASLPTISLHPMLSSQAAEPKKIAPVLSFSTVVAQASAPMKPPSTHLSLSDITSQASSPVTSPPAKLSFGAIATQETKACDPIFPKHSLSEDVPDTSSDEESTSTQEREFQRPGLQSSTHAGTTVQDQKVDMVVVNGAEVPPVLDVVDAQEGTIFLFCRICNKDVSIDWIIGEQGNRLDLWDSHERDHHKQCRRCRQVVGGEYVQNKDGSGEIFDFNAHMTVCSAAREFTTIHFHCTHCGMAVKNKAEFFGVHVHSCKQRAMSEGTMNAYDGKTGALIGNPMSTNGAFMGGSGSRTGTPQRTQAPTSTFQGAPLPGLGATFPAGFRNAAPRTPTTRTSPATPVQQKNGQVQAGKPPSADAVEKKGGLMGKCPY
jgi:hypothetical protein